MQAYLLNVVQKECIDCKTGNGFAVVEFCSRVCVEGGWRRVESTMKFKIFRETIDIKFT